MYYAAAKLKEKTETKIYRSYIADVLQNVSQNAAVMGAAYGGEGRYITVRYSEILQPAPVETRTAEEIIESIRAKIAQ